MKIKGFVNPENLQAFLADKVNPLYLNYNKDEKYYVEIKMDISDSWKYEVKIFSEYIEIIKKNQRDMIALWKLPKKERKDFEQRYAQLTKKNVLLNEKVNFYHG